MQKIVGNNPCPVGRLRSRPLHVLVQWWKCKGIVGTIPAMHVRTILVGSFAPSPRQPYSRLSPHAKSSLPEQAIYFNSKAYSRPHPHRLRSIRAWCRRRDSNPHGSRHRPLKTACLPVPPLRHRRFAAPKPLSQGNRGLTYLIGKRC